jgi:hypothetical protein
LLSASTGSVFIRFYPASILAFKPKTAFSPGSIDRRARNPHK